MRQTSSVLLFHGLQGWVGCAVGLIYLSLVICHLSFLPGPVHAELVGAPGSTQMQYVISGGGAVIPPAASAPALQYVLGQGVIGEVSGGTPTVTKGMGGIYAMGGSNRPIINISLLLQGLFDAVTMNMSRVSSGSEAARHAKIVVEARRAADGSVALNPSQAVLVRGQTEVQLDSSGSGSGTFSNLVGGDYHLAFLNKLGSETGGPNHLSFITSAPVRLIDEVRVNVNLADPAQSLFRDAYRPSLSLVDALLSRSSRKLMRIGDMDGNGIVDVGDYSRWRPVWISRRSIPNPENLNGIPITVDLDGNGIVDVGDYSLWRDTWLILRNQDGRHSYVP